MSAGPSPSVSPSAGPSAGRVVVGYDGSEAAEQALHWAAARAARRRLPLELVHAVPVWPYDVVGDHLEASRAAARECVDAAAERLREQDPALDVSTVVEVCSPASLLLERSEHAEAVVLGRRGRGGFAGLHLGSTAAQVASHAGAPVVVVRETPGTGVVVGVDGSPASDAAVRFAFEEADAHGEALTAVHAWLPVYAGLGDLPYYDDVTPRDEEDDALLAERLSGHREEHPDVEVRRVVRSLHPVPALLEAAQGARLLVVGSHGRGALAHLLMGSVSTTLLHHAPCTIAVVRP